ncbi:endonuclease domain-containing protein [Corynebacterium qintianiae]|uniref:endonuclease domain-containing protein n=1 Tax=Corynebacterium qintianiae TaxID=2709392 RepID=UPI0013EE09F8|nr:hypothetical protein [Corynebacterium qintianiae]
MGEKNFYELLELIRNTRALSRNDLEVRRDLADGKYVYLAPTRVLPKQVYDELAPWRAYALRAVAIGLGMYKGAVVSRAAAALRGMWILHRYGGVVEVALPSGGTPSASKRMPGVRYREATFRDDELVMLHGVRTTTDVRTFIDIARYHGFREGIIAADWLLARGYQRDHILQEVHRMGRFVGKKTVLVCVAHATCLSESPYESLMRAELIQRAVTGWEFQRTIGGFRPDFLFDDFLILEIDGRSKYAERTAEVLLRERDRERALTNLGCVFIRVYPEDLIKHMDEVLRDIERARQARRARPGDAPENAPGPDSGSA